MNKFAILYFISIILPIFLISNLAFSEGSGNLCMSYESKEECLVNEFKVLYNKDYDLFFNLFHSLQEEARTCANIEKTSKFLTLVEKSEGNAELAETFSEFIEKLTLSSPTCLLKASLKIVGRPRKLIFWSIKEPLFHRKEEIEESLMDYRNQKMFRELFREMDQLTSYPQRKAKAIDN